MGMEDFGNNLTVKGRRVFFVRKALSLKSITSGGILTVADDFLKNDGQKFLSLMEELASRRIRPIDDEDDKNGEIQSDEEDWDDVYEEDDEEEYDDEEVCFFLLFLHVE